MTTLLRIGTASAFALSAALASTAVAQDSSATQTTTATTADPATDTTVKTTTKTTAKPSDTVTSETQAAAAAPAAGATPATPNPAVGGAAMDAAKTVVDNASAAPNLTTLVGLVKAADLVTTLSAAGPFTVFAPTNDAFGRVAQATRDGLAKPEAKPTLARVLKYHVVPGTLTLADLKAKAAAGGTLITAEGQNLTVKVNATAGGEAIELTDAVGNKSYIETADVRQSNGIVHVVNGVLFPKLQ